MDSPRQENSISYSTDTEELGIKTGSLSPSPLFESESSPDNYISKFFDLGDPNDPSDTAYWNAVRANRPESDREFSTTPTEPYPLELGLTETLSKEDSDSETSTTMSEPTNLRSASSQLPQVEPLTEKDQYDVWAKKVFVWFMLNDLDGLLDGSWTYPTELTEGSGRVQRETYHREIAKFKLGNKKGMAAIRHSCGTGPDLEIEKLPTAKAMWDHLKDNYIPTGGRVFDQVVQEIWTCRNTTKSVQEYASKLRELASKAARIDESCRLTDRWLAVIFMQGLGQEFQQFLTSFKTQNDLIKDVTFDSVVRKAVEHEASITSSALPHGLAMMASSSNTPCPGCGRLSHLPGAPCCKCNMDNHTSEKCTILHPELRQSRGQRGYLKRKRDSSRGRNNSGRTSAFGSGRANFLSSNLPEIFHTAGFLCPTIATSSLSRNDWLLDTGADSHISNDASLFISLNTNVIGEMGTWMEGTSSKVAGRGTAVVTFVTDKGPRKVTLNNVIYAPNAAANLLSLSAVFDRGFHQTWDDDKQGFQITKNGEVFAQGTRKGGHFVFSTIASESQQPIATTMLQHGLSSSPAAQLWHQRLAHLSPANIERLTAMADGISLTGKVDGPVCEACILGKQKSQPHSGHIQPASNPGELIHMDICGPLSPDVDGNTFFITFIDDWSKLMKVTCLKAKSDAFRAFKRFKKHIEAGARKIRRIRSDNGGEFISKEFKTLWEEEGIEWEPTTTYSPEQNGAAERPNLTLMERVRAVRIAKGLPYQLWSLLLQAVVYLKNRSPVTGRDKTPIETWTDIRPNLSHLRILGCNAYVHTPKEVIANENRGTNIANKLVDRSKLMQLVGYEGNHIYVLWNPATKKVVRSSDVVFDEQPSLKRAADHDFLPANKRPRNLINDDEPTISTRQHTLDNDETGDTITVESSTHLAVDNTTEPHVIRTLTFLSRQLDLNEQVPQTYKEAMASVEAEDWQIACDKEYESFITTKTWTLVPKPANREVLRGRWVFRRKRGKNGEITKYKARWCIRGDMQKEGIDYQEVFSSVVKSMTYKLQFNRAAVEDLEIEQMDVKTAFLNSQIDTDVYMYPPDGFGNDEGLVCKLNKAIYGLKQAPRAWYFTISKFLQSLGFKPCDSDPSVFVNGDLQISVYVDDLLIFGKDRDKVRDLKKALSNRFEMEDLGPCSWYLGIDIQRDRSKRTITLSQRTYIEKVLREFQMIDCTPTSTPMAADCKLHKTTEEEQSKAPSGLREKYQRALGSLMYAMLGTRADIAYAVKTLSRFASNPSKTHWTAMIRVLKYLKGTLEAKLVYKPSEPLAISGYTDAAYKDCPDTSKSSSGYTFNIGSAAISWSSKLQSKIATSTTHSEFIGEFNATKEALFLTHLAQELWPEVLPGPIPIYIHADNNGAVGLASATAPHSQTKHFDRMEVRYVQEQVQLRKVLMKKIHTDNNIADIFTKPLSEPKFTRFRLGLGIEL
jgi:transposase InsO family protein